MRVFKLNSSRLVKLPINKYRIDWRANSASKIQTEVKNFLYKYWKNYIVLEEAVIPGSLLRIDFLNCSKKIVIEVSPSHHMEFNSFFHKTKAGFTNSLRRDLAKAEWIEKNGFKFIELNESDWPLTYQMFIDKFNVYL